MIRTRPGIAALIGAFALLVCAHAPSTASADDDGATVQVEIMKLEIAQKLAQAALEFCRERGFQVAVSVVDRFGNPQVLLRDRYAGAHTHETARRKAWTAVSFRTNTLEFAALTKSDSDLSGIRFVNEVMAVGGGIPVEAGGSLVGAVGVSGAPGGAEDHACSEAGIAAVEADLAF